MPAKNKPAQDVGSIHSELTAHMAMIRRAESWAERVVQLRTMAKTAEADCAEQKVIYWLQKAIDLEHKIERSMPAEAGRRLE